MPRSLFPLPRPTGLALACALTCALSLAALSPSARAAEAEAENQAAPPAQPIRNSSMDAPMFYQLLVGEMELRSGEVGVAY
ncbi:MAG TPA: hypothetical protein VK195_01315, partial [Burkholderiaceae bacterium]|nr:hypothetical protein [Burkholderiaceae bacterium]